MEFTHRTMAHLHPVDEAILQVLAKHAEGVRLGVAAKEERAVVLDRA